MSSIRRARVDDAKALGRVFEAAFAGYREAGLAIPPVAEGLEQDIETHEVWVAEDANGLLGGVILSVNGGDAHLVLVAVSPEAKGLGLGKALIETAINHARSRGVGTVRLATHSALADNIGLYEHLGWTIDQTKRDKVDMVRVIKNQKGTL